MKWSNSNAKTRDCERRTGRWPKAIDRSPQISEHLRQPTNRSVPIWDPLRSYLRNCEREDKVLHRKEFSLLLYETGLRLDFLAVRAVSFAEGTSDPVASITGLATVERIAELTGFTTNDQPEHLSVMGRHSFLILRNVSWSELSQSVGDRTRSVGERGGCIGGGQALGRDRVAHRLPAIILSPMAGSWIPSVLVERDGTQRWWFGVNDGRLRRSNAETQKTQRKIVVFGPLKFSLGGEINSPETKFQFHERQDTIASANSPTLSQNRSTRQPAKTRRKLEG